MGGSALYNPTDLTSSQLANGVYVATRLGEVAAEMYDADTVIYKDIPENAQYGYIYWE